MSDGRKTKNPIPQSFQRHPAFVNTPLLTNSRDIQAADESLIESEQGGSTVQQQLPIADLSIQQISHSKATTENKANQQLFEETKQVVRQIHRNRLEQPQIQEPVYQIPRQVKIQDYNKNNLLVNNSRPERQGAHQQRFVHPEQVILNLGVRESDGVLPVQQPTLQNRNVLERLKSQNAALVLPRGIGSNIQTQNNHNQRITRMIQEERKIQSSQDNVILQEKSDDGVEEDGQVRCQCRFCCNMIFLEDLDTHEQSCEISASEKEVSRLRMLEQLNSQPRLNIFQPRPRTLFPINPMIPQTTHQASNQPTQLTIQQRFTQTTHPSGVVPIPKTNLVNTQLHDPSVKSSTSEEEFDYGGSSPKDISQLPSFQHRQTPVRNIFQFSTSRTRLRRARDNTLQQQQLQIEQPEVITQNLVSEFPRRGARDYQPPSIIQQNFNLRSGGQYQESKELQGYELDRFRSIDVENEGRDFNAELFQRLRMQFFEEGSEQNSDDLQQQEEEEEDNEEENIIANSDNLEEESDENQNYYQNEEESDEDFKPVPQELLAALPINKFTEANKINFSEENKLCTICQSNYEPGDQYLMLMCLHRFHNNCILQWFQSRDTCPICKQQVCVPQSNELHQESVSSDDNQNHLFHEHQRNLNSIQINQMVGGIEAESEEELPSIHSFFSSRRVDQIQQQVDRSREMRNLFREQQQQLRGVRQILQEDEAQVNLQSRINEMNDSMADLINHQSAAKRVQQNPRYDNQIQIRNLYERSAFDSSEEDW